MKKITILLLCWGIQQAFALEIENHGYMRAGVGMNSKLGNQECFTNRDAGQGRNEFRLGNECTNYGEMVLKVRHLTAEKPFFDTNVRLAYSDNGDTTWDSSNSFAVRELYFQGGKFFNESWSYWAGKKFYREQDVFMDDYYYFQGLHTNGAGIEGVELGPGLGRISLALLQETSLKQDNSGSTPVRRRTSDGVPSISMIDVRLNGVVLNALQELNLWGAYGLYPGGKAVTGDNSEVARLNGFLVGALLNTKMPGGFNHTAISYGQGILKNLNINAIGDYESGAFGKNARTIRFVNHLTVDFAPIFATHFALSGELLDNGMQTNKKGYWVGVGVHPVVYINDHYQLTGQAGTSMVKNAWEGNKVRRLTRFTIAPQVSVGRSIWARPVIRAFYSYSFWNDNNKGKVGADSYANENAGAAFGIQGEAWF